LRTERPVSRRLLAEAKPARQLLIVTVALGLVATGAIIAQAGLLARALATAAAGGLNGLASVLAALLAVVILRAAASYGGEAAALHAAAHIKERLRCRLVRHAVMAGPGWLGKQRSGEVTMLATAGLDSLDPYFGRYLPQILLAGMVPLAVLATVTALDWVSGLIIAVTLPLIPAFAVLVGLHTKAHTQRNWQLLARLGGHFLDVVQGLSTLKTFGRAKDQERIIGAVSSRYRASVMSNLKVAFLSALVLELSAALATALIAVEVGLRLLYGHLGYSTALFVLLLTPEAYLSLRNVAAQYHASADGTAAARRVFEILDNAAPHDPAGAALAGGRGCRRLPDARRDTIAFEAVTVAYPGRSGPVIDRADLAIAPGDTVTLAGGNGAGKTSLLTLLLKFTEPADGRVTVGGIDLAAVPAASWREQIGWLPQHPSLFPWSIAQNIALGQPDVGRLAVVHAAEAVGAAAFIDELPNGYDTVLDERALRLSAGQRQRIALARLFIRQRPLLLLDEPTAHLDPESAAEIDQAVSRLAAGRTVILVTHQRTSRLGSNRAVVVADGRVTELSGTALTS